VLGVTETENDVEVHAAAAAAIADPKYARVSATQTSPAAGGVQGPPPTTPLVAPFRRAALPPSPNPLSHSLCSCRYSRVHANIAGGMLTSEVLSLFDGLGSVGGRQSAVVKWDSVEYVRGGTNRSSSLMRERTSHERNFRPRVREAISTAPSAGGSSQRGASCSESPPAASEV
jgi:hypothetical protein